MDVLVISISISSYQVVDRVRKNVKIVVRVVVKIVVVYTFYKLSNKDKNKRNEYDAKKSMKGNTISLIVFFLPLVISIWFIPHEDTYKFVKKRHSFDFK